MSRASSTKRNIPPIRATLRLDGTNTELKNNSSFFKQRSQPRKPKYVVALVPNVQDTFQTSIEILKPAESSELINSRGSVSPTNIRNKIVKLRKPVDERAYHSIDIPRKNEPANRKETGDESQRFKQRLTTPWVEERLIPEDLSPQNVLGTEAVTNFYSHYKKLEKVTDVNKFMQVKDAVYTSVLRKSESLQLLPSKIGFIKERGEDGKVQLNHFRLGDKYAEVLSEGIRSMKGFDRLELSNNRITEAGANVLISKINNLTKALDLSGNSIGKMGVEHLCNVINLRNSQLLEVNLEANKLGDYSVNQLCDAVAYSNTLRKLNIGKNFLTDAVIEKVCKMLEYNGTLEELYLHWNQIKSPGGAALVSGGLKSASKLRVLDLAWNALGQGGSQFSKTFASFIGTNTSLVHLDLSNNYISKSDATIISEELKANHTLYGFHFHGNIGYVDFKGFLVIPKDGEQTVTGRVIQPPINGVKSHPESLKHHIANYGEYQDVCWICEGWRPMEVSWIPGESGPGDREPVYCHLSFEGFKGVYLPKRNGYRSYRMVPPIKFEYFYTVEGQQVHAENEMIDKPQLPLVKVKVGEETKEVKLQKVNLCKKGDMTIVIKDDFEAVDQVKAYDIKPRISDEIYIPPEVIIERPKWSFPVSIFRQFKQDTQVLLDECFRVDFENTRISKIVKNPDDFKQVRELFYASYRQLKDCYKYYAAIGAPSEIWSIPLNTFTEFCQSCKIIDGKVVKLSDFDRIFIATYTRSEKDRNPRNPDRALVRYQFLEGLVRLAEHKYVASGAAPSYYEGIKMLMDESLSSFLSGFDHQQWRQERYWNEMVDTVYKSYFPVVRGAFRKYYGTKTLPGQKKFMALEEFHKMLGDANMFNDNCGERDATLGFSLAMMTQVDELNSDRIYQMQFVEFIEALARVVDKHSPHPYGYLVYNPQTGQPENEMPYDKRFAQPLHIKLEGIMPSLFAICGNDVKELWALPETSIFEMQEVDPRVRFPSKKKKILRINPTSANSIEPYDGFNALNV